LEARPDAPVRVFSFQAARAESHASRSESRQREHPFDKMTGRGKLPAFAHRQMVAVETEYRAATNSTGTKIGCWNSEFLRVSCVFMICVLSL